MTQRPAPRRRRRYSISLGRCGRCGGRLEWAEFGPDRGASVYACDRCGRRCRLVEPRLSSGLL
jgi:hypothetical protein